MENHEKQCPLFVHANLTGCKPFGDVPPGKLLCTDKCAWYEPNRDVVDCKCAPINALYAIYRAIYSGLSDIPVIFENGKEVK